MKEDEIVIETNINWEDETKMETKGMKEDEIMIETNIKWEDETKMETKGIEENELKIETYNLLYIRATKKTYETKQITSARTPLITKKMTKR